MSTTSKSILFIFASFTLIGILMISGPFIYKGISAKNTKNSFLFQVFAQANTRYQYSIMATTKVRLAVAAYHSSTFRNPKIENAGNKVQIVVLDGSFAYKEVTNPIPEYKDGIDTMCTNGQLVFGYVTCKGDEVDICNVRTGGEDPDIPQEREGIDNWYNLYHQIDGIYLDEGPLYEAIIFLP